MSNENEAYAEMPRYKCHKEALALKIKETTEEDEDGSKTITPEEKGYASFRVDQEYVKKHNPQAGGYYIVYKDGYRSFSPREAFEGGYTKI